MSDSKLMLFKGPLCQDPVEAYLSLFAQAILDLPALTTEYTSTNLLELFD